MDLFLLSQKVQTEKFIGIAKSVDMDNAEGEQWQLIPITTWNLYEAAINGWHKTNNVSEGWHNRFRLVIGKHHPDLYSALKEFQKEQADAEITIAEVALGRKVKEAPKNKWITSQQRIQNIVKEYETYKNDDIILQYLTCLAHNMAI